MGWFGVLLSSSLSSVPSSHIGFHKICKEMEAKKQDFELAQYGLSVLSQSLVSLPPSPYKFAVF